MCVCVCVCVCHVICNKTGSSVERVFFYLEVGVSIFYTLELFLNAYVHSTNCFYDFYSQVSITTDYYYSLLLQPIATAQIAFTTSTPRCVL